MIYWPKWYIGPNCARNAKYSKWKKMPNPFTLMESIDKCAPLLPPREWI